MIAVPATWYSGWTDTNIAPTVLHSGAPYCLEAMSLLDWISSVEADEGNDAPTLALASVPGDFGLDSMAGALKWAEINGVEVVHDGSGTMIPGQDLKPVADAIVASGADIVFTTAGPTMFSEMYGAALAQGLDLRGDHTERAKLFRRTFLQAFAAAAQRLKKKLDDLGLQAADIFLQMDNDFTPFAVNHPQAARRRPTGW